MRYPLLLILGLFVPSGIALARDDKKKDAFPQELPYSETLSLILQEAIDGKPWSESYEDPGPLHQIIEYSMSGVLSPLTPLHALATDATWHGITEKRYQDLRKIFEEKAGTLGKLSIEELAKNPDIAPAFDILKRSGDLRSFLKEYIVLDESQSGFTMVALYALGVKEDIDFLVENLSRSGRQAKEDYWLLATILYREGVLDIPQIMGHGKEIDYRWVDLNPVKKKWASTVKEWWKDNRDSFKYDARGRGSSHPVWFPSILSGISAIEPAPPLRGVFWLEEGGRDYAASLNFYDFESKKNREILSGGYDGGGSYTSADGKWKYTNEGSRIGPFVGIEWVPETKALIFTIRNVGTFSVSMRTDRSFEITEAKDIPPKPMACSRLPQEQRIGKTRYEVSGGDLFIHQAGQALRPILTFGNVEGITVDPKETCILFIDHGIAEKELWVLDLNQ